MKARVKATGEIIDETAMVSTLGDDFYLRELEPISENTEVIDYWTRLEHQYAGMAMQAYIIASHISQFSFCEGDLKDCKSIAHALVEKMKEERK